MAHSEKSCGLEIHVWITRANKSRQGQNRDLEEVAESKALHLQLPASGFFGWGAKTGLSQGLEIPDLGNPFEKRAKEARPGGEAGVPGWIMAGCRLTALPLQSRGGLEAVKLPESLRRPLEWGQHLSKVLSKVLPFKDASSP